SWKCVRWRKPTIRGTSSDKQVVTFSLGRTGEINSMSAVQISMKAVMEPYETLFRRHAANPILTGKDWPYSINSVFNAGATLLPDGSTLLLCRVEDRRGLSHLCAARSVNGVDDWRIDHEPTLLPSPDQYPEEVWGIE